MKDEKETRLKIVTPVARGYYMPAEGERHRRTWMSFPCRADLWGKELDSARMAYSNVARAISAFEPVTMVVRPQDETIARDTINDAVEYYPAAIDDSWLRDNGPIFVKHKNGHVAGVAWRFNAWGEKHLPYDQDAALAAKILASLGSEIFPSPMVLEGGAISVDGEGTLLTTKQCLLNPNRNPNLEMDEIEALLENYLGVSCIIWLGDGYDGDETDGHIDEIAAFVRPGLVAAITTQDRNDANYPIFKDNLARLRHVKDAHGRALEIVTLPQPARQDHQGARLTLSYTNFYLCNGGLIMPRFAVPEDDIAAKILVDLYPDRRIVGIDARPIVIGGGGIHCITQQEPA